jgi:hypothetical protein
MNNDPANPSEEGPSPGTVKLKTETEFTLSAMRCAAQQKSHAELLEEYMRLARTHFLYIENAKILLAKQWGI